MTELLSEEELTKLRAWVGTEPGRYESVAESTIRRLLDVVDDLHQKMSGLEAHVRGTEALMQLHMALPSL